MGKLVKDISAGEFMRAVQGYLKPHTPDWEEAQKERRKLSVLDKSVQREFRNAQRQIVRDIRNTEKALNRMAREGEIGSCKADNMRERLKDLNMLRNAMRSYNKNPDGDKLYNQRSVRMQAYNDYIANFKGERWRQAHEAVKPMSDFVDAQHSFEKAFRRKYGFENLEEEEGYWTDDDPQGYDPRMDPESELYDPDLYEDSSTTMTVPRWEDTRRYAELMEEYNFAVMVFNSDEAHRLASTIVHEGTKFYEAHPESIHAAEGFFNDWGVRRKPSWYGNRMKKYRSGR